jgi:hypothetical protein
MKAWASALIIMANRAETTKHTAASKGMFKSGIYGSAPKPLVTITLCLFLRLKSEKAGDIPCLLSLPD